MSGKYIFELVSTIASPSRPPSLEFSSSITCWLEHFDHNHLNLIVTENCGDDDMNDKENGDDDDEEE